MALAGEDCPTKDDGSLNPDGCANGACEVTDPDGTTRDTGGGKGGKNVVKRGMNNFF